MVLFYTITEIIVISMMIFSVICYPSGNKILKRKGRGIFGPEPKLLEKDDLTLSYYNDTTENTDKIIDTTGISTVMAKKKWQVGRVSRKQYEIVNMIWRKTKIFLDTETTTISTTTTTATTTWKNEIKTYLTQRSTNTETLNKNKPTESYIEFYYLDEIDSPRNDVRNRSSRLNAAYIKKRSQKSVRNSKKFKSVITNSPFLAFYVNISPQTKPPVASTTISSKLLSSFRDHRKRLTFPFLYYNNFKHISLRDKLNYEHSTSKVKRRSKNIIFDDYKGETCPITTQPITESATTTKTPEISTESFSNDLASTLNDRIKFFEIYDRQTENEFKIFYDTYQNKHNIKNYGDSLHDGHNVEKNLLEHVDISNGHHEGIHMNKTKKHVNEKEYTCETSRVNMKASTLSNFSTTSSPPSIDDYFAPMKDMSNYSLYTKLIKSTPRETYVDLSKVASWSDYSFAAVYVYEPSQILCDAAAISQHWLITAGSCLSRQHRFEPSLEGRPAFVTYCGAAWRHPERIAYVKYTLVHPKFNTQERSRRFLYNIGVIRVVGNLMYACPGWVPVTLMSHQFTTNPEGSVAAAIGWGLDRYAAIYPETEIPTHPLMLYNGLLHSNHCPGNIGYNEAKLVEPLHVMKNVYCLSLPPYDNEESDPVHGSLLLIGGQLIALYLQEERRGWGEQSAQYTGVWRLIPWVLEVAKEPENIDAFTADI